MLLLSIRSLSSGLLWDTLQIVFDWSSIGILLNSGLLSGIVWSWVKLLPLNFLLRDCSVTPTGGRIVVWVVRDRSSSSKEEVLLIFIFGCLGVFGHDVVICVRVGQFRILTFMGRRQHCHVLIVHELNFVYFERQLPGGAIPIVYVIYGSLSSSWWILSPLCMLIRLRYHSLLIKLSLWSPLPILLHKRLSCVLRILNLQLLASNQLIL